MTPLLKRPPFRRMYTKMRERERERSSVVIREERKLRMLCVMGDRQTML